MKKRKKTIIITGCSGFIGYHVSKKILNENYKLVGIDNHNNYYDVNLKKKRLAHLKKFRNFKFYRCDIKNKKEIYKIFKIYRPDFIVNLAAQAGVRYSFIKPQKYIDSNITGFVNILEIMKKLKLKNLIYASSSSVYGNCKSFPFKENSKLNPLNLYGQTKLYNEKISEIYKKNYKMNLLGLRLFTVYGPYGRPDMFIPKILKKISKGDILNLYNNGNHFRDFTYVEDVANIVFLIIRKFNFLKKTEILNICRGKNINIRSVVSLIQSITGKKIKIKNQPFQRGDMKKTHGSNQKLKKILGYNKFQDFAKGIKSTIQFDLN